MVSEQTVTNKTPTACPVYQVPLFILSIVFCQLQKLIVASNAFLSKTVFDMLLDSTRAFGMQDLVVVYITVHNIKGLKM